MSSNPMYGLFGASEDEPLLNDEQLGLTTVQFGHSVRVFLMSSVSEDVADEDILYRKLLVGNDSVFDDDADDYMAAFGDSVSSATAQRDRKGRTFGSREKRRSLLSFCSDRRKGRAVKPRDKTLQIITSEISDIISPIDSLSDYESLPDPPSAAYLELLSGDDHILYTIQNLDSNKVKFLKQSHTHSMKIATLAHTKCGEIRWDESKDDELVVALVKDDNTDHLDSSDSSVFYIQTWRDNMDTAIADVLRDIKVHPVTVMHILWPEMKQKKLSKILPQTSDEVMVSLSDDQPGYIVIGVQDRVLPIVQNLLVLVEQAEEEHILKKYAPEQVLKAPEGAGSGEEQQERKIYEERDKIMFLQRHCSSSIDIIRRELSVTISFDLKSNCIIMCGSKAEEAFSRIKALVADVKMEVYKSMRMGARKYFKSATGETSVRQAEDKYKCFIHRNLERREAEQSDGVASADIEVVLKLGDIALTKVDVIVNSTNERLDLSGSELSKAIVKVGGAAIQTECKELYPQGCRVGDVVKTRPGKLHCKELYHCCLSDYRREHPGQAEKLLREIILQCLHKASVAGHSSVAFPPIGTGKRQYPTDEVARTFREAIKDFTKSNHFSSLAEVMIVCYHTNQDLLKIFKDAYDSEKTNPRHSSLSNISMMTEFHIGHVLLIVKEGNVFKEDVDVVVVPTDNKMSVSCEVKWTFVHEFGDNTFRQWKESNIRKSGGVMLRVPGHHCSSILGISRDFFTGDLFMMICKCLRKAEKNKVTSIAIPVMTGNTKGESLPAVLIKSVRCLMGSLEFVREVRLVYTDPATMVAAVTVIEEQLPSTCVGRYRFAETTPEPPAEGSQTQSETDDCTLQGGLAMKIVCNNRRSFGECQQFLDNLLMENLSVETLENPTIGDLTEQQVQDIQRLCADIDVTSEVDTTNCVIYHSGMKVDAIKAKGQTQEVLKNIEFVQKNLEKAELLRRLVEWWYITEDGHEMSFAPMTSMLIEEAFLMRSAHPTAVVQTATCKVNIDFTSMDISSRENPNHRFQIIRKKGPAVPLPDIWEDMGAKDIIAPRIKDGPEADKLRQMFMSNAGNKYEIMGVYRIQHKYLYEQYQIQKEAMEKNYPHKSNERHLWHGTNVEAIKNINKYGFNRGYCGKNGTKFGRGVYFATEASYSSSDVLSVPDESKHKYIYLAQVLTGVSTKGSKKMFDTPLIDRKRSVRYGCTVDNSDNPSMYVVFRDTQAYPKYLFVIRKKNPSRHDSHCRVRSLCVCSVANTVMTPAIACMVELLSWRLHPLYEMKERNVHLPMRVYNLLCAYFVQIVMDVYSLIQMHSKYILFKKGYYVPMHVRSKPVFRGHDTSFSPTFSDYVTACTERRLKEAGQASAGYSLQPFNHIQPHNVEYSRTSTVLLGHQDQISEKKNMSQQLTGLTAEDDRRVIVEPESTMKLPDREVLWRYFESREVSGGRKLDFMDVLSDNTARLTFRDPSDAANIESRDHEVNGIRLMVYPYYSQPQKSNDDLYDNRLELSPLSEDYSTRDTPQPEDAQEPEDSQQPEDSQLPEDVPEPQQRGKSPVIPSPPLSSEELNISSGKVRYMKTFPSKSLQSLIKDFVEVEYATEAVIVKGNGSDFKKKVNSLKMAILDIKEDTFEMHKRHVYEFLTSSNGRKELRKVEDRFRCAISVDQGVYSDLKKDGEPDSSILGTNLKFIQGDIVRQRADVLVHTVEKDLDLSQGSPSIAQAGGDEVQAEYRTRYPNGIKYGKIAKTRGGNLSCKEVFHCCLPEYSSDPKLKLLEKVVYKCLYDASMSDYRSMALPALGTDKLGYPPDEVAQKMLTVMLDFIRYTSSLKCITIVIGPGNSGVVRAFEKEKIRQHRNSKLSEADVSAVADAGYPVGKFKVHLRHGDISKEKVICIVHFTNSTTPLNIGILSSPLSVACGKDLELQCQLTAGQMKEKRNCHDNGTKHPCRHHHAHRR
ncbi:uncharacterized protein LOC124267535 [Haliotis rubra]|uniref:uncharacterized protein LOC124267535 n=1 Tax=Haliotis rubra TaxID=36100 RepID=UPI001EE5AA66|nr:uncharacterized protein LOC124267535 [Haliotis rubra]